MESTKERVVRIATDLFAKNGYQGTGLTELSEAVKLGRGSLYHHIGSKDLLHIEIAFRPITRARDQANRIVAADLPATETVRQLSIELTTDIDQHLNQWIVWFREFSSLPDEEREKILQLRTDYIEAWSQAVHRGLVAGDFTNNSVHMLDGLLPMFIYAVIWNHRRGQERTAQDIGEELGGFLLRGLGAREDEF